jgi:hypothetical protein
MDVIIASSPQRLAPARYFLSLQGEWKLNAKASLGILGIEPHSSSLIRNAPGCPTRQVKWTGDRANGGMRAAG